MKELCPNLVFVGKDAKKFEEMEVSGEQLADALKCRERGANFGARIRAVVEHENKK